MSDKNTIDGKIFDFAYELAMRDATMRTAFTGTTIYALLGKRNPNTKYDATSEQKKTPRALRMLFGAISRESALMRGTRIRMSTMLFSLERPKR